MEENRNNSKLILNVFLRILPIQIVSGIVLFLHSLVDSILVGRFLGETSLAIIGLAVPIGLTTSFFGNIIACGSQIMCGNAMGRGENDKLHASFSNSVLLSVLLGLATTLFCFGFSRFIPVWFGVQDPQMQKEFTEYLKSMCLGFPFAIFFQALLSFLELDDARRFAFLSTLAMILSKILLDLLCVFVLHNGMFGIGLSTALSYFTAILAGLICFFVKCRSFRFCRKTLCVSTSVMILKKGVPGGLQNLASIVFGYVLNVLAMKYGGSQGVSILTAAINSAEIFLGTVIASFTTAAVIISVFFGSRDYSSIKKTCIISIISSWIISTISFVILFFISDDLAFLYGLNSRSAPIAAHAMRCLMLAGFVCWGKMLNLNVFKSMGKTKQASICCLSVFILVPCIASTLLCVFFGLNGLWFCYLTENSLSTIILLIYCSIKRKHIPRKMSQWIYLPQNEDTAPRLDVTMSNSQDVVMVSEKVITFCRQNGIDKRRGYFSGLCIEELADNIFQHNSGRVRKLSAELHVIAENGDLLITLSDNGRPFNPNEYLQMMTGVDAADNIGMKLVSKIAKEIRYTAPFGLNMLTIQI